MTVQRPEHFRAAHVHGRSSDLSVRIRGAAVSSLLRLHSRRWAALAGLLLLLPGCGINFDLRLPDPNVRYIAFGDSATVGTDRREYPEFLAERLGEPQAAFAIEGKGGEQSGEGLLRLQGLLETNLFPNANVLLYWEGGNDVIEFVREHDPDLAFSPDSPDDPLAALLADRLDFVESNVRQAIRIAANAGLVVFVATYFPVAPGPIVCDPLTEGTLFPDQVQIADQYVQFLNDRLRLAASDEGAVLVDIWEVADVLRADAAHFMDCSHLSTAGNEIAADVFYDAITSFFADRTEPRPAP